MFIVCTAQFRKHFFLRPSITETDDFLLFSYFFGNENIILKGAVLILRRQTRGEGGFQNIYVYLQGGGGLEVIST